MTRERKDKIKKLPVITVTKRRADSALRKWQS